jgi:receptor protein-tyrosine kinase
MSLIEQAAKRLEELRRAGAGLPEDASAAGHPGGALEPAAGNVPTPEAAVHALGARAVESAGVRSIESDGSPGPDTHRIDARLTAPAPVRFVDIDLERLKQRGFVTPDAPKSQIADEFRVIKRPIIRNAQARSPTPIRNGNLVMITSALPAEGKTFTAINLAISVAMEFDNTVLLVDGDVAHPSLPDILGLPPSPGLLDLLTRGSIDVADALVKTNIEKLTVLPAGSRHRRATELLASEQMASLLRELGSRYSDRIIIFDSPPLLATTEARVLATHMGQVIMVVAANSTTRHAVSQALATVENCDIVLMMLNKASKTDVGDYYGYYADDASR